MRRTYSALAALAVIGLAACDAPSIGSPNGSQSRVAFDQQGGNSASAHACQKGGWANLQGADGTLFKNAGDCTSYAAQGGTLVPIPRLPVIISFTLQGFDSQGNAILLPVFTGGTGEVRPAEGGSYSVTSGVPVTVPNQGSCGYILVVSNSLGEVISVIGDPGSCG